MVYSNWRTRRKSGNVDLNPVFIIIFSQEISQLLPARYVTPYLQLYYPNLFKKLDLSWINQ